MLDTTNLAMKSDFEYCRLLVKDHDYDRYLMGLCAPRNVQNDIWAVLAFNHEIAKTREIVTDTKLGLIRLQWWRDEIDKIYDGCDVKQNQVLPCLSQAIQKNSLKKENFETLLYAREFDLEDVAPENLEGLVSYADYTNTPLLRHILDISGARMSEEAIRHLAIAYGLSGLLLAVPYHRAQSRCFLPSDLFTQGDEISVVKSIAEEVNRNLDIAGAEQIPQPFKALSKCVRINLKHVRSAGYDPSCAKYKKQIYFKSLFVLL
ncbi:MAG: squalene/phytoene synthase family protein [Alphaproteobacteria bacterium]|nr:squalene/phytoene synthase family protein [Alphaproteobacteria bacterium]